MRTPQISPIEMYHCEVAVLRIRMLKQTMRHDHVNCKCFGFSRMWRATTPASGAAMLLAAVLNHVASPVPTTALKLQLRNSSSKLLGSSFGRNESSFELEMLKPTFRSYVNFLVRVSP